MAKKTLSIIIIVFFTITTNGCSFYHTVPEAIDTQQLKAQQKTTIKTPTKAHLKDGSVILFSNGFEFVEGYLYGSGEKFSLSREYVGPVDQLAVDDVAALEHYEKDLDEGTSTVATIPAVALGAAGALVLAVAVFGSCPTVYSLEGEPRLEAELFSHSITRRFERNDLDRLNEVAFHDDGYRLRLANEAPETHYINQLSMITVDHSIGTRAYPSPDGEVVLMEGDADFTARNCMNKNILASVAAPDGDAYRSDDTLTQKLTSDVVQDWIELTVPVSKENIEKSPVVALRLRNTLMATVLFYDVMLKSQGANALQWLGSSTRNPIYAWKLSRWFRKAYGLHVQYWNGNSFSDVATVSATGPIAWHDVAVVLPKTAGLEARIRISFLPDNWMIDWVDVGFESRSPAVIQSISPDKIDDFSPAETNTALTNIQEKDSDYLLTYPGENHTLFFPADPPAPGTERTCFLQSKGFYIEWLRENWFNSESVEMPSSSFEPGDSATMQTAKLWLQNRASLERLFDETKIPLAGGAK